MRKADTSGIRIILVRHGETEWNRLHRFQGRSDLPLNERGKKQAHALAAALKNETITAIYTSPLKRTVETANHIGRFHPPTPIIKESGLMEMDLGKFEGMAFEHWAVRYSDFRKAWEKNPAAMTLPGGESLQQVQKRAVDTLERIVQTHDPGCTLLICSHNFVITSLLCHATKTALDQFRELRQETASMNIIYKDGNHFHVEMVNDQGHLQD